MTAERLIARLERLVGFDTQNPPGAREAACADWVAAELRALGLAVEIDGFDEGRANVVATLENGPGPCFAFNTHMDVVPVGAGWTTDPMRLTAVGDRLHGRGACDAKGPLAAMLEAVDMLAAGRSRWSGTLMAVFVADEEASSRGARRYAATKPPIDYVVVGEPSGNAPIIAHKGSLRPLVRVGGRTAHSGTPDLGLNAIFEAGRLLPRIAAAHAALKAKVHPLIGSPSLTVTRANAGVADNVVPDACDLLLDRRLIPGETEAAAVAEIEAMLQAAGDEDGIAARIVELKPTTGGAADTPADHPIVLAASAAGERHGVGDARPIGFQGACDFVHFREVGAQGVVLGPGDLAVAHKPDEYVPRAELEAAALIYRDIALAMLPRS
ncbi:M20 family metallopeptidase [Phreatobacter cathodiphilus]|uniref:Acetylornithine deacetylase n=1 Tax=Phreatobacter cathodiphilus TaxID=1868589 RepID=A0A2S0N8P6_9HYPH|nr:M20 family metallopeptidase [Phreatobacter cathodiphilus]AVO44387.1 acetylornithine deacetylase [Phreatobacter cathodiphilus]